MLVLLLATALAQEPATTPTTQAMAWDIAYQGKPIGTRTVTVKYLQEDEGMRRILESVTAIDGAAAGLPYTWNQRFSAMAVGRSPASFTSAIDDNGSGREVQGRLVGGEWMVTLVESGRSRSWEVPGDQIDLSTADLFDPESFVPIGKFSTARMLSAETGDVWTQPVERLGPSTITIDGEGVPVEGWAVDPPQGRVALWYTTDGVLVRYEYRWMGRVLDATLRDPPPPGIDDAPIPGHGAEGVGEKTL